ncbi:unnamed protein product [Calypogeia fissa]
MAAQALGSSSLFLCFSSSPSPARPVGSSRASEFGVFSKKVPCIVRKNAFAGQRISVQQCQERKSGRLVLLAESVHSSAPLSPIREEACEDIIEAGQLARVAKLYRPAVILPGLGNSSADYDVLVQSLEAMEVPCTVVQVARVDWLRNAAGLLDGDYWRGRLRPRPVLNWYLDRVKTAMETAKAGDPNRKVSLIGHSAGGWLARVYMAEFGTEDIALLLTLGTPHLPPPRGIPGVFDQSRGLLYHVEENCPGAYHAPSVKYVCVAGRYVKGGGLSLEDQGTPVVTGAGTLDLEEVTSIDNKIEADLVDAVSKNDNGQAEKLVNAVVLAEVTPEEAPSKSRPTFRDRLIGAGYKQVCGKSDVWGDGVVPEESAYLEGAVNIRLDGAYHSPVGADDSTRPWYGSAGKIDQWVQYLLDK